MWEGELTMVEKPPTAEADDGVMYVGRGTCMPPAGPYETPQKVGAKVSLDRLRDSLTYFTDGCRFVYEWSDATAWFPPFRVVLDESPIPYAAVQRLREFKTLLTPDLLRTIGIAGAVWLDRLLEVHAYGGYAFDEAESVAFIPGAKP